jgi:hypothetical protein
MGDFFFMKYLALIYVTIHGYSKTHSQTPEK